MCTILASCQDSEFRCRDTHCIAYSKVCNGHDDCGDGSDELVCGKIHILLLGAISVSLAKEFAATFKIDQREIDTTILIFDLADFGKLPIFFKIHVHLSFQLCSLYMFIFN